MVHVLSPQNKMWILNFKCLSCSYIFAKVVLLKVVHPLKTYQRAEFHDPQWLVPSITSTSEVQMLAILEWLKL
jgi:hypothetical protein